MKIRHKVSKIEGWSTRFNNLAFSEVIGNIGDDYDSWFTDDLEVRLSNGKWKDMRQAFKDRDIIPDNSNTYFEEPKSEEYKARGYNP